MLDSNEKNSQNSNIENSNQNKENLNESEEQQINNEDSENINDEEKEEEEEEEEKKVENYISKNDMNENNDNNTSYKFEETRDSIGRNLTKPHFEIGEHTFITNGKFMEINPHYHILNNRINDIRNNIYNNTKETLILKGSIQNSKNHLRENSNRVIKNIIEKIWIVRKMCENESKNIQKIHKNCLNQFSNVVKENKEIQDELNECEYMLNHCENEIGYKLLGNPCYSFMKVRGTGNQDGIYNKTSFK